MPAYDVVQVGYEKLGVWTDVPAPGDILSSATIWSALRFQVPVTLATGRRIALDPPTFTSLGMSIWHLGPLAFQASEMQMYYITDPNPRWFAATSGPSQQMAEYGYELVGEYAGTVFGEIEVPLDLDVVFPVYRSSDWLGYLNFVFQFWYTALPATEVHIGGILAPFTPELQTEELPFVTGISGPVHAQSRVDRCGRCGLLDVRERFVRDGYTKGLWVCPDCWDPEEDLPRPIPPDRPPIND